MPNPLTTMQFKASDEALGRGLQGGAAGHSEPHCHQAICMRDVGRKNSNHLIATLSNQNVFFYACAATEDQIFGSAPRGAIPNNVFNRVYDGDYTV